MLEESPIRVIGTTREDCAGYAADGYARIHGLGAVCVTYCVGGLSLCNSIAGAYAEKSPVIVISGAPGHGRAAGRPAAAPSRARLQHAARGVREDYGRQRVLDDPLTAFREIDRCLEAAVRYKRPVYLELPRDRVKTEGLYPHTPRLESPVSDKDALREAVAEASALINNCKRPVILAGVEIHRFGLREDVLTLAEKNGIAMTATLLGKSVVSEKHPLYVGVYEGAMGRETVRKFVEESDCVILLGTFMTDINLGIYTANLDPGKLHLRHQREAADSAPPLSRRAAARLPSRTGQSQPEAAETRAAQAPQGIVRDVPGRSRSEGDRQAAVRADQPHAGRRHGGAAIDRQVVNVALECLVCHWLCQCFPEHAHASVGMAHFPLCRGAGEAGRTRCCNLA
jgi:thiamine pyrophosphate-dependent acetolactate synthase large subunit-like protein